MLNKVVGKTEIAMSRKQINLLVEAKKLNKIDFCKTKLRTLKKYLRKFGIQKSPLLAQYLQ